MLDTCALPAAGIDSAHFQKFCPDLAHATLARRQTPSNSQNLIQSHVKKAPLLIRNQALLLRVTAGRMQEEEEDQRQLRMIVGRMTNSKKIVTRMLSYFFDICCALKSAVFIR